MPSRPKPRPERLLPHARRQRRRLVSDRMLGPDEHQVARRGLPRLHVRKHRRHRGVDGSNRARVHFVRLQPLEKHAVRRQAIAGRRVVFAREQARHARAERIGRLRRNDVVPVGPQQQQLARVPDRDVHLRVVEHVAVDGRADSRDFEDERLELDDVHALDGGNRTEPSRRAAGAQADDERPLRAGVQHRTEEAKHDLCSRVADRAAVRLAVDDKRIARGVAGERDAAFRAVTVPHDNALTRARPRAPLVGCLKTRDRRAARADRTVAPHRGRAGGHQQRDRRGDERHLSHEHTDVRA